MEIVDVAIVTCKKSKDEGISTCVSNIEQMLLTQQMAVEEEIATFAMRYTLLKTSAKLLPTLAVVMGWQNAGALPRLSPDCSCSEIAAVKSECRGQGR